MVLLMNRFIDEMYKWSGASEAGVPARVLDVGCGIGGTSRYLAKKLGPSSEVGNVFQIKRLSSNWTDTTSLNLKTLRRPDVKTFVLCN